MAQLLRQSTQVKVPIGPVVAVANGYVPVTSLDLSTADEAEILKHDAGSVTDISGATFAAITGADGYYNLTLSTSHTDTCGMITVLINDDSLCLPVKAVFQVVEEAIYDALFAASATGLLPANVTQIGGDAQSATDLKDFADAGYDPSTNKVQGVVLVDTTTTNTDMRGTDNALLASSNGSGLTEAGGDGDHLTAINLPNQTMDIVGNITGNLSGSVGSVTGAVGSVTGAVGSVTGNVGGNVTGSVGSVLGGIGTSGGTITTLDALNTAQDVEHSTTQGRLPATLVNGRMNSTVSAINDDTAAAARLALSAAQIIPGTVDSTAFAPTTTEFEADDITEATAQHYNGRVIIFTSGVLIGQATSISNYSLATGRGHLTVVAMTEAPGNNDTFIIV